MEYRVSFLLQMLGVMANNAIYFLIFLAVGIFQLGLKRCESSSGISVEV